MSARRPAWRLAILAVCGMGAACAAPTPRLADAAADAGACASEAEQLVQPVAVYAAPRAGLDPLAKLADGRFVYRCERRGEWLAIMFPRPGEAVDCTVRPAGRACAVGWIQGDLETTVLG